MDMENFIYLNSLLSNRLRVEILIEIAKGDKTTTEITKSIGVSQPLAAIYLKQLENCGLIKSKLIPDQKNHVFRRIYSYCASKVTISKEFLKDLRGDKSGKRKNQKE